VRGRPWLLPAVPGQSSPPPSGHVSCCPASVHSGGSRPGAHCVQPTTRRARRAWPSSPRGAAPSPSAGAATPAPAGAASPRGAAPFPRAQVVTQLFLILLLWGPNAGGMILIADLAQIMLDRAFGDSLMVFLAAWGLPGWVISGQVSGRQRGAGLGAARLGDQRPGERQPARCRWQLPPAEGDTPGCALGGAHRGAAPLHQECVVQCDGHPCVKGHHRLQHGLPGPLQCMCLIPSLAAWCLQSLMVLITLAVMLPLSCRKDMQSLESFAGRCRGSLARRTPPPGVHLVSLVNPGWRTCACCTASQRTMQRRLSNRPSAMLPRLLCCCSRRHVHGVQPGGTAMVLRLIAFDAA